jgi:magnesium-transporting ATPase (P-type)
MTVIVRDPEGLIRVMCKGADSVIEPRLKGKPRLWEKTN